MSRPPGTPDRRDVLTDAAIDVLATEGVRGLTHRAVDARADLPNGSTSNLFRTRHELVMGVVRRFAELDLADLTDIADAGGSPDAGPAGGAAHALLDRWGSEHSNRLRARLALAVEGLRDPDVRAVLDAGRERIVARIDELRDDARAHGRPDPLGGVDTARAVAFYSAAQWARATQGIDITTGQPLARPQ